MSLKLSVSSRESRDDLWRRWRGEVPSDALDLVPALFDLIDEREEEIQSLRRERDTLVEAYLHGQPKKAWT